MCQRASSIGGGGEAAAAAAAAAEAEPPWLSFPVPVPVAFWFPPRRSSAALPRKISTGRVLAGGGAAASAVEARPAEEQAPGAELGAITLLTRLKPRASPPRTPPPAMPSPLTSHTARSISSRSRAEEEEEEPGWERLLLECRGSSSLVQASTVAEPLTTGEGDVATEAASVEEGGELDALFLSWTATQTSPEGTTRDRSSLIRSSRTRGGGGGGGGGGRREEEVGLGRAAAGRRGGTAGGRAAVDVVPVAVVVVSVAFVVTDVCSPPMESSRRLASAAAAPDAAALPSGEDSCNCIEPRALPGTPRQRNRERESLEF